MFRQVSIHSLLVPQYVGSRILVRALLSAEKPVQRTSGVVQAVANGIGPELNMIMCTTVLGPSRRLIELAGYRYLLIAVAHGSIHAVILYEEPQI